MTPLTPELRSELERAILVARDAAETACSAALEVLGVGTDKVPGHLDEEQRQLRVALRAKGRQLGGQDQLIIDCAYEQWHRMLFARFLAENELLIHPTHDVALSIADCEEMARERGDTDPWPIAASFAAEMLPGIFRADDPALGLTLAPEHQQALEQVLAALPSAVFTSDDALGWVYQYWQAKKKDEVNSSERKIGGSDIAPVTQLFTEHYMVCFLLENSLGAWWAARHPESPLIRSFKYLRFDDEGRPAAGELKDWPSSLAELKVIDPCCGSGHFLVTAFEMLRQMRMEEEELSAAEAGDAVIRDNLYGLELDPRCTQIAAFAVAIAAWKSGGYRSLPLPNIACSGISAAGNLDDWKALAEGDAQLEESLERLHGLFTDAADLGSLIDPRREVGGDLLAAEFSRVVPLLEQALSRESGLDPTAAVFGAAAAGAARAASLLADQYTLVVTNPPFLGASKQSERLRTYTSTRHANGKADLATSFLDRFLARGDMADSVAIVAPETWLFLSRYEPLRVFALEKRTWHVAARLGARAFRAISGEVVRVALQVLSMEQPAANSQFLAVDASEEKTPDEKRQALAGGGATLIVQASQLENPDARITFQSVVAGDPLSAITYSHAGLQTGDYPRFGRVFWELAAMDRGWEPQQTTPDITDPFSGCTQVVLWEAGAGALRAHITAKLGEGKEGAWIRGLEARGHPGICVASMSTHAALYMGTLFDNNCAVVVPESVADLPAIWAFMSSPEFTRSVRALDPTFKITNSTFAKVSFDLTRWQEVAEERYPNGLPAPHSDDPTQWLFNGHPSGSDAPLQVAVARLLGYCWPRQTGSEFRGCPALDPDGLEGLTDEDGVVCLPAILGKQPTDERLRSLLEKTYEGEWSPAKEADLLSAAASHGKSLDQWLRKSFFEQHCQLYHQRPFVWHIWDGHTDGFAALLNYHKLNRARLELLTYTYLGNWIERQQTAHSAGEEGAEARLVAANALQDKLKLILEGEAPYDIFVRWKPLEEQPMGWEPDLDDGVRVNIRPFVDAGVLRKVPKIKWGKDRGKDRAGAPWFKTFGGERINDHHLTLAEKRAAR